MKPPTNKFYWNVVGLFQVKLHHVMVDFGRAKHPLRINLRKKPCSKVFLSEFGDFLTKSGDVSIFDDNVTTVSNKHKLFWSLIVNLVFFLLL